MSESDFDDPLWVVVGFVGGYFHLALLVPTCLRAVSGDYGAVAALLPLCGASYVLMVMAAASLLGGRDIGETGVRFVARMVAAPYAVMIRITVRAMKALPGAVRTAISWLVTPKEGGEDA